MSPGLGGPDAAGARVVPGFRSGPREGESPSSFPAALAAAARGHVHASGHLEGRGRPWGGIGQRRLLSVGLRRQLGGKGEVGLQPG